MAIHFPTKKKREKSENKQEKPILVIRKKLFTTNIQCELILNFISRNRLELEDQQKIINSKNQRKVQIIIKQITIPKKYFVGLLIMNQKKFPKKEARTLSFLFLFNYLK